MVVSQDSSGTALKECHNPLIEDAFATTKHFPIPFEAS